MPYIVYTTDDIASSNIAAELRELMHFNETGSTDAGGHRLFVSGDACMLETHGHLYDAEYLNETLDTDMVIFLSRHASESGLASFTAHSLGNWSDEARYGGRGRCLSVSSPDAMARVISALKRNNTAGLQVTYEATHHGPLMDTPSFFVELGGDDRILGNKGLARIAAAAVSEALVSDERCDRTAIGIGGTHYPDKFTRLTLDGRFSFSHIMSRHYVNNVDMIDDAVERSDRRAELAVIEWKSIKAADREIVISKLNELGIDYERV